MLLLMVFYISLAYEFRRMKKRRIYAWYKRKRKKSVKRFINMLLFK
jgi:hypothetical protein